MNGYTIRLGEVRLAKYNLSNKAALLDQASLRDISNKGLMPAKFAPIQLSVPVGAVVLDEVYRFALANGLIRIEENEVQIVDAAELMKLIELPPLTGKVAVRSAFTSEDGAEKSMAGAYESVLNVPIESYDVSPVRVRDPKPLADALARVWSSGVSAGVDGRLDIIVMEMVDAKFAGVAFTESDYEDDLVNYTTGLAADMLAGKVEANTIEIPKVAMLEPLTYPHHNLPFVPRLQNLMRSVRAAMGGGDWDVEWADDGAKIWVLQIRPITAPTVRNEAFVYGPVKEALPDLPSRFMATLIESCGDDIFRFYRDIDPKIPSSRKYIEVFYGRPMMNASLLTDVARHWGLPTSMVTDVIGKAPVNEMPMNRRRLFKSRSARLALRLKSLRSIKESRALAAELVQLGENPGNTLTEVIESARTAYTKLTKHMIGLREVIGASRGVAGIKTLGSQMYDDLQPLREMLQVSPSMLERATSGEVPRDATFRNHWEGWLRKHGHRAMYETDLSRPRFRENQAEVLQMLAVPGRAVASPRKSPLTPMLMRSPAARANAAREELRFDAMVAFEKIRARLLQLALPKGVSAEAFWSLSIDESRRLDEGWRPSAEFIAQRKKEVADLAAMRTPDSLRRNDPIGSASGSLQGIGLSRGEASGRAWVLREPSNQLPEGFSPETTILVAPSVDAGWVTTFSIVGGVVVESGGNLSHGSIILRELGLPAVTQVNGATHQIQTGQKLRVAASQGRVDLLG